MPEGKEPRFDSRNPPATPLLQAVSAVTKLTPAQAEEFDALVEKHGGWPTGKPRAVEEWREIHVEHGRSWVTHAEKEKLTAAATKKSKKGSD